uniref:SPRY domain-containing protein 7 n=1 Tax=Trichobilharzia regenti TaxID=157069 RepID=A0AA85JMP0_TRIRE|nr:unnamed protein product [Trichobilharzia regenti]
MKFYVKLDVLSAGPSVLILKSGLRICSNGAARTNIPILQDYAYFEVKLQNNAGAAWAVGLCTNETPLDSIQSLTQSSSCWILKNDMKIWNHGKVIGHLVKSIEQDNIIGVYYDKEQINQHFDYVDNINGVVYPVLGVEEDSVLDVMFTANSFKYPPPIEGFGEITFQKEVTFK